MALSALSPDRVPEVSGKTDNEEIVALLTSMFNEAETARQGGPNSRDDAWRRNWDLYWNRHDFSNKAPWQSQVVMPEAPNFIDRWAAALREALTTGGRFFSVTDPGDPNGDLAAHVERLIDYLLERCGRTPAGHVLDFSAIFEEQMKLGAISMCSVAVVWRATQDGGYVACETVDPREVYLDHTSRTQYRIRRTEVEKHELVKLAKQTDEEGQSLYDLTEIELLAAAMDRDREEERRRSSGHDQATDNRSTVALDEYLCTLVSRDGDILGENVLCVLANKQFLIRGPEPNPFWHERDWIVTAPIVTVPLSVYGKSYVEEWAPVAEAFTEMTNLILDATFAEAIKAFVAQPDMLEDPTQMAEGVHPGKTFTLAEGMPVADFMKAIDVGAMGAGPVRVWEALKNEIREGAKLNEIALGQLAPTERTATEISQTQQSSSAIIRSIARTVESRFLEPVLHLMFVTAMQHLDFESAEVRSEIGEATANMFAARRQEFATRRMRIEVRGISSLIDRQARLRNMLALLQVVGSNELLLQQFLSEFSPPRVFAELVRLFGVDPVKLRPTEQEKQVQALAAAGAPGASGGSPPGVPGEDDSTGALG